MCVNGGSGEGDIASFSVDSTRCGLPMNRILARQSQETMEGVREPRGREEGREGGGGGDLPGD